MKVAELIRELEQYPPEAIVIGAAKYETVTSVDSEISSDITGLPKNKGEYVVIDFGGVLTPPEEEEKERGDEL